MKSILHDFGTENTKKNGILLKVSEFRRLKSLPFMRNIFNARVGDYNWSPFQGDR